MARRFDLSASKENVQRRNSQRDTYGNQTPLSSTAVERGETHWMDGSYVRIDGLLDVNGTATVGGMLSVTGTLNGSGSINFSGSTGITGPLNVTGTTTIGGNTSITGELVVTGPTTLDGETEIGGDTTITGLLDVTGPMSTKGTLSVEGVTTLKNDLEITDGGKIKAGNLEIEPANGGQINFTGGSLSAGQFGALLNNTTMVELQSQKVRLNTSDVSIAALPSKPESELTPIGIDVAGRLHRIS